MNRNVAVGVVGLGRMGLTLAAGFARAVGPAKLFAVGRSPTGVTRLREAVPGAAVVPLAQLPGVSEVILLCVRNADLPGVLDELRPRLNERHVVVTLNNGLPLQSLEEAVDGRAAKLIPSVGNEAGAGATLLVPGSRLTENDTEELLALLRCFSTPFVIEEDQGRTATDLASCGPALLAAAARAMVDAQQERGGTLTREMAERLVAQSLHAVSRLVAEGASLEDIVERVAVPGGNTAAGLEAARDGLVSAWRAAFRATEDNERSKSAPRLTTD